MMTPGIYNTFFGIQRLLVSSGQPSFIASIMSHQPSPGPSQANATAPPAAVRSKPKSFAPGIAAGAEDVKYQAKYKELKRKVKEIEAVSFSIIGQYLILKSP